ncbi:unnamed protein product [Prorocentrum cordatum]|uniref:Transmembrane protein 138 n=1 Tax=Prorocentrum cordatum TaxID=2364126 RepID=A0ABN9TVL7_9DINO|nr:unnamed protein product [Polarella glacialis]
MRWPRRWPTSTSHPTCCATSRGWGARLACPSPVPLWTLRRRLRRRASMKLIALVMMHLLDMFPPTVLTALVGKIGLELLGAKLLHSLLVAATILQIVFWRRLACRHLLLTKLLPKMLLLS